VEIFPRLFSTLTSYSRFIEKESIKNILKIHSEVRVVNSRMFLDFFKKESKVSEFFMKNSETFLMQELCYLFGT
jgi:hypothetical protein